MTFLSLNEINSNELYAPIGYEKQFKERVKQDKKTMNKIIKHYTQNEYTDCDGVIHQGLYHQLPFGTDNNFTEYKYQEPKILYKDGLIHIRTYKFLTTEQLEQMIWELDSYFGYEKHNKHFYGYSFEVHKFWFHNKDSVKNYSYRTILF